MTSTILGVAVRSKKGNNIKLLLTSDWHLGLTKLKTIEKMLGRMVDHCEDDQSIAALLILGDFCGGKNGARSVQTCLKTARQYFPELPIIITLGNHDYWTEGRYKDVPEQGFHDNYRKIVATCKEHHVHLLDTDGPYRLNAFTAITGHTMWYQAANPNSNDGQWLPRFIDDLPANTFLSRQATKDLERSLAMLTPQDSIRIFASHFPVVPSDNPGDEEWAGPTSYHAFLREAYGFSYFLNGHTHKLTATQGHWCPDSDYYNPRYIVVEI